MSNHNPRVGGSSPSSATNKNKGLVGKPFSDFQIYRHCVGTVAKAACEFRLHSPRPKTHFAREPRLHCGAIVVASPTIGTGTELSTPLAKLFKASGRAAPLVCCNLIGVLVCGLLFGNRDEQLKDTIKAFTVNEAVEQVFGAFIFGHTGKTIRTCLRCIISD